MTRKNVSAVMVSLVFICLIAARAFGNVPTITTPMTDEYPPGAANLFAMQNSPFSHQIVASDSPTSYDVTGLPTGIQFDSSTGLIHGTPTSQGTWNNVVVTASNGSGQSSPVTWSFKVVGPSIYTGTTTLTPYFGSAATVPGRIFCVNYDLGGEGVAYHEDDVDNHYAAEGCAWYRSPHDDVDIPDNCQNTYSQGGFIVGVHGNAGEWLKYSINVISDGTYTVEMNTGVITEGGLVHVEIDGANNEHVVSPPITVLNNNNYMGNFATESVDVGHISAGSHVLKLCIDNNTGMGFNWINFICTASGGGSAPVITSALTASCTVGQAFPTYTITANNSPTSFNAVNLPAGLSIAKSSGQITGTPTTICTNAVTISASNTYGVGTATLTIKINGIGIAPVITSPLTASGTVGQVFPTYTITANNSPTKFNALNLPAGLSVGKNTGQITGTPTTACTNAVTISASNTYGVGTATLTITISGTNSVPTGGSSVYQIDCGSSAAVSSFAADNGAGYYLSGGSAWTTTSNVDLSGVSSPAPVAVYQSARYTDNLGYIFSNLTVGAKYKVRLHFADIFNSSVGPRVFNITVLHASQAISNFDLTASAGGMNKAVIKEFTVVADSSGQVDIWLHAAVAGDICEINGIEILTSCGPQIRIAPKTGQANMIELSWPADIGTTYQVYKSTNLLSGWPAQPVTNIVGDGTTKLFSDTLGSQKMAYYRLKSV